jgi:hypothetical protein
VDFAERNLILSQAISNNVDLLSLSIPQSTPLSRRSKGYFYIALGMLIYFWYEQIE